MPSITVFALLPPPAGEPLTVGRSSSADVQLPHASVSRSHATLRVVDGRWVVHDGRSSNGTFVGETAAHAPGEGDPTPLVQGQAVRFGDVNAVFLNADGLQRLVASARALRR